MIDSATPMFTSEFTIMPPPQLLGTVGPVSLDSGLVPHMINEWNPMMGVENSMSAATPQ